MKKIYILIGLMISMSIQAISQELIPVPTSGSIKKMDLSEGKREVSIKLSDGSKWEMIISVPKIEEDGKVDLLLALHWGVRANKNAEFMDCLILPSIDKKKYLVVSPIANKQLWWESPKETQLLKLIDQIRKYWPINKVIVAGYSDGGTGTVYLASKYPAKFDGAIALAGNYIEVDKFSIPTYIIHGRNDELFDHTEAKKRLKVAKKANDNLKFVTSESLFHFQGCKYVPYLRNAFIWIEKKIN